MVGTLPETNYLLLHNDYKIGIYPNKYELLLSSFTLCIDTKGFITLNGKEVYPSYNMDEFTIKEITEDFAKHYLEDRLPSGYEIYRFIPYL